MVLLNVANEEAGIHVAQVANGFTSKEHSDKHLLILRMELSILMDGKKPAPNGD